MNSPLIILKSKVVVNSKVSITKSLGVLINENFTKEYSRITIDDNLARTYTPLNEPSLTLFASASHLALLISAR